jgi:hypothetical protein
MNIWNILTDFDIIAGAVFLIVWAITWLAKKV